MCHSSSLTYPRLAPRFSGINLSMLDAPITCLFKSPDGLRVQTAASVLHDQELVCTTLPAQPGAVELQVVTGGAMLSDTMRFLYHTSVGAYLLSPAAGPSSSSTVIAIQGLQTQLKELAAAGVEPDIWCRFDALQHVQGQVST